MASQAGQAPAYRELVLRRDGFRCRHCGVHCQRQDADVHHLIPRSLGGSDDPSNLITLCDGCHAAHHPNLQVRLSRRLIERWGLRLARWLDRHGEIAKTATNLTPALRLFGLERFRDGQLPVVLAALAGRSVLLVSPTGSGKSLCFQLPSVLQPGTACVISPLKVLMSDQISELQRKKLPGTFINSDLDREEKAARYELLANGAFKFLYLAPERFAVRDKSEVERLRTLRPNFLVVDEAHCIDSWGDDFRPEYGRLGEVRAVLGQPPVLAFTATAGVDAQQRIIQSLNIPDAEVIVHGVDRPNIGFMRLRVAEPNRPQIISDLLTPAIAGKVMIFVPSIRKGEELQARLKVLGHDLPFYHGQIQPPHKRETLLKRFTGELEPGVTQIICTNAFGMGLDVPNVRLVIHYQQPASVEDYLQEFGRAGRDGKPSLAVLLTGDNDTGLLTFMARKTVENAKLTPADASRRLKAKIDRIETMQAMALAKRQCMRSSLLKYFEGGSAKKRPSLALRIVTWLYASRTKVDRMRYCCDHCNKETAANFRAIAVNALKAAHL
jgi:ATP-dependent DNA helicase RecQ